MKPRLALLMVVCEGEESLARDTLFSLVRSCAGAELTLFLVDDASPSRVGERLAAEFRAATGRPAFCHTLSRGLGLRGMARRLFLGLECIASSGEGFDLIVKADPDACITREGLLASMLESCPDGRGLFGELYAMRRRDALLLLADLLPAGFTRKVVDGVVQRDWRLGRLSPVWWSDFGLKAIANGFRMKFMIGGFFFLGGVTLRRLAGAGYLARDQSSSGFTFTDDVLITMAVHAVGEPVVDLRTRSRHWGLLRISEAMPVEAILAHRPFVIHQLKDRPKAWEHRRALKAAFFEAAGG